jgi:hypothetical protein
MWDPRPDFHYGQKVSVLSMWGALSGERTGLSLTAVKISSICRLYLQFYMSVLYTIVKRPVPCGFLLFTVLHVTVVYKHEAKSIIICNAVVFVFVLAALSFCAESLCVVSVLFFLRRLDVPRSVLSSLPCR